MPFCVFKPPFGDLGATYDHRLRLTVKHVGDFLLVLTELFSLGVTAEGAMSDYQFEVGDFVPTGVG